MPQFRTILHLMRWWLPRRCCCWLLLSVLTRQWVSRIRTSAAISALLYHMGLFTSVATMDIYTIDVNNTDTHRHTHTYIHTYIHNGPDRHSILHTIQTVGVCRSYHSLAGHRVYVTTRSSYEPRPLTYIHMRVVFFKSRLIYK